MGLSSYFALSEAAKNVYGAIGSLGRQGLSAIAQPSLMNLSFDYQIIHFILSIVIWLFLFSYIPLYLEKKNSEGSTVLTPLSESFSQMFPVFFLMVRILLALLLLAGIPIIIFYLILTLKFEILINFEVINVFLKELFGSKGLTTALSPYGSLELNDKYKINLFSSVLFFSFFWFWSSYILIPRYFSFIFSGVYRLGGGDALRQSRSFVKSNKLFFPVFVALTFVHFSYYALSHLYLNLFTKSFFPSVLELTIVSMFYTLSSVHFLVFCNRLILEGSFDSDEVCEDEVEIEVFSKSKGSKTSKKKVAKKPALRGTVKLFDENEVRKTISEVPMQNLSNYLELLEEKISANLNDLEAQFKLQLLHTKMREPEKARAAATRLIKTSFDLSVKENAVVSFKALEKERAKIKLDCKFLRKLSQALVDGGHYSDAGWVYAQIKDERAIEIEKRLIKIAEQASLAGERRELMILLNFFIKNYPNSNFIEHVEGLLQREKSKS